MYFLGVVKSKNRFKLFGMLLTFQNAEQSMIFNLNSAKNSAYKIGIGKPFWFDSLKVTPKPFVESNDAYTKIFSSDGFKNPRTEIDAQKYLDAFTSYIKS